MNTTRKTVIHPTQLADLPVGTILMDRDNSAVWRDPVFGWCAANGTRRIDTQVLIGEGAPFVILWQPGGTNADTHAASAVSQAPHTLVLTDNEGGFMTMRIECSAAPDAPCRRRPPDWMDRENWTDEEATETGHGCWAVEWAEADPEGVIWNGGPIYIPISVTYDEGVEISPLDPMPTLPPALADQHGAEPTEAEVTAGAEAIARNHGYPSLSAASVYGLRVTYLADARAALVAARKVSRHE
ncbi:MAG: hypothetical protein L0K47_13475 [Acidipropionibacterium jensenii]|uniref:hypothetical protein n=1 Tax=Acidipropionibacterium jensenii TaxID=1749 RepID=UPI002649C9CF|nr:hypothetical protein [Acidipropionibacterium jensenii]MDN5964262.1 hypothetical protein [Actinomyces sp.]MDN6514289.1 hypothetical protein [Acidipropionibacterium jensenii]MDN6566810.1 hypothetical protein [Actinomyces sp.]MDN6593497.1 hypothetical protein [Acidipropionibacterium jensenii]MDN6660104.1 hypothetical protein [Acidipropionibacterium jensenii]